MKIVRPSRSYTVMVPDDISEDTDAHVVSFWMDGQQLLLQFSSFLRLEGQSITAEERLRERMDKTPSIWKSIQPDLCSAPAVDQAAAEQIENDVLWIHAFFVWPHLTVYATICGPEQEVRDPDTWARAALKNLRLSLQ